MSEKTYSYAMIDTPHLSMELFMAIEDAQTIATPGPNDYAVAEVAAQKYIASQFEEYDTLTLAECAEYMGDDFDPYDRQGAIEYIVWCAAWDIAEMITEYTLD